MKIYTKTGDAGETSLFSGGRVKKDNERLHAYGTIDELNSVLGMALSFGSEASLTDAIRRVQSDLMHLGADLATPFDSDAEWIKRMTESFITHLENEIDLFDTELTPLKNFILPGGTPTAATLHQARTVCRRAERWMVAIQDEINPVALVYVNRLSDWLFTAARVANARAGIIDPVWKSES